MNCKKPYQSPEILRKVAISSAASVLAGSIVDKANVVSQGQQVDTYNWTDTGFNHDWE